MADEAVRLTPSILRVVAENTKIRILHQLLLGPRIPADLSRKLGKTVPTILEHLATLENAGLVERREQPGRKYVFYALTRTGEALVSSKSRLSIVLYSSIALFVLGISMLTLGSYPIGHSAFSETAAPAKAALDVGAMSASGQSLTVLSAIEIAVFTVALILLVSYLAKSKKINIMFSG